jgi:AraC-like DNA-binding protein
LAEESGIARELLRIPDAQVTPEQFSQLYRLLSVELDDEMPGAFSRRLKKGTLEFLCLSVLDSHRLEGAVRRFVQFFRLILDDFIVRSYRKFEQAHIELVDPPNGPGVTMAGCELMLKLVHGVASWLIGQNIPLITVAFRCSPPTGLIDRSYLFPQPVLYGQTVTKICFDEKFLDIPLRQRKSDLHEFLRRAPDDWMFVPSGNDLICHNVSECIKACLPANATIENVAQRLHYSVRTLCRRLEEKGKTFQAIKDDIRRDIAIYRLAYTNDAISAIAYETGFNHTTAFHRAFRHWTGQTPIEYRNNV